MNNIEDLKILLANEYTNDMKIDDEVVFQPKLDGMRCIYYKGKLFTRNKKEILGYDHIIKEIKNNNLDYILDGELYSHKLDRANIVGTVKGKQKQINFDIKFHIFDIVDLKMKQKDRIDILMDLEKNRYNHLEIVKSVYGNKDMVDYMLNIYISEKYEGLIIRKLDALYVEHPKNKINRTNALLKYKKFEDKEFEIVGFTNDKNDCIVLICKSNISDATFNCSVNGSHDYQKNIYLKAKNNEIILKTATIKYQKLFDSGVPEFGKCIEINREDNIENKNDDMDKNSIEYLLLELNEKYKLELNNKKDILNYIDDLNIKIKQLEIKKHVPIIENINVVSESKYKFKKAVYKIKLMKYIYNQMKIMKFKKITKSIVRDSLKADILDIQKNREDIKEQAMLYLEKQNKPKKYKKSIKSDSNITRNNNILLFCHLFYNDATLMQSNLYIKFWRLCNVNKSDIDNLLKSLKYTL